MAPDGTEWWTVVVEVPGDDVELVSTLLWDRGAGGIEERGGAAGTLLLAGFPSRPMAAEAADRLDRDGRSAEVRPVTDDGLDGWRAHARPHRAGPFLVVPAWVAPPRTGVGEHLISIDPGRTFGSGSHPTSRLVLAALPALVGPGTKVLDVGAGSGILSVGAAALGATVTAIDVDPASPEAVTGNAAANGQTDHVHASTTPLDALVATGTRYHVVLANLLAPIVVDLAGALRAALAPGGNLLVSGLLAERWEATTAHLDLPVVAVTEDDGWVAVQLGPAPRMAT